MSVAAYGIRDHSGRRKLCASISAVVVLGKLSFGQFVKYEKPVKFVMCGMSVTSVMFGKFAVKCATSVMSESETYVILGHPSMMLGHLSMMYECISKMDVPEPQNGCGS